ncbi:MAG: response regulator [Phycisphaeraceae bacterium]|nr:response regulator [Phycisphaerae bacterium]MBX3391465.1 response regulator [Phycisphaeraceae bacterium]HRJ49648.1 response regulator [Phycisphaerales bacterium]
MPRVVLADDEHPIRLILSAKLRERGYEVIECRDGDEAYESITSGVPDVLVTDFQMPLMSGLELAMRLRSEPGTCHLPILMLTARGHSIPDHDLARTNIRAVLPKPFSVKLVLERVASIVSDSASSRAA